MDLDITVTAPDVAAALEAFERGKGILTLYCPIAQAMVRLGKPARVWTTAIKLVDGTILELGAVGQRIAALHPSQWASIEVPVQVHLTQS